MKQTPTVLTLPRNSAPLRDLTGNAPLRESSNAAMSVADALQHVPHKGARMLGAAASFLLMAECAGLNTYDLMAMARNCMNDAEGRRPEFSAVEEFIRKEILNF